MIQRSLADRVKNLFFLFGHSDPVVEQMTNDLWGQLESEERIYEGKASRTIQVDSMVHSDAINEQNTFKITIVVSKCRKPKDRLQDFYDIRPVKHYPFRKLKSVVHKLTLKNMKPALLVDLHLLSCKMS